MGAATAVALAPSEIFLHVDIDLIEPSPYQPRTRFREDALEELAQSIRSSGIVQPLVVRRHSQRYQLIAGERRWRAAQRAQMHSVPVVVRDVPEGMAMEMTLVENLQREDLNPIEQAHAFQRLTDEFHLTQEQVAERTGKDRTTIANAVRLLKLESADSRTRRRGQSHRRPCPCASRGRDSATPSRTRQENRSRRNDRSPGRAPRHSCSTPDANISVAYSPDPNTKAALEELQREYGTRAVIHPKPGSKGGELAFEYYDDADLARLYDHLMRK